jgi:class 3 adenylate cyclase
MLVMPDQEKTVVLQADVRNSTRTRLKLQAVRLGITMSLLADEILDEGLKKLEQQEAHK